MHKLLRSLGLARRFSRLPRRRTERPFSGLESLEHRALMNASSPWSEAPRLERDANTGPALRAAWTRPGSASLGTKSLSNVAYATRNGQSMRLDVYLPRGQAPAGGWPVILAIHGGGWRKFSKDQYGPKVAPALLSQGFAVVAPNYSLASPGRPSWPFAMDDLRGSVRWIRENSARYKLDGDRIAAMGESAGGHLAALLGSAPDDLATKGISSKVQAVVSFYGPTDLTSMVVDNTSGGWAVQQFVGSHPGFNPRRYQDASPLDQVTADDAPMMLIHGTADSIVPTVQSIDMDRALKAVGIPSKLVVLPGAQHGFGFTVNGRALLPEIIAFLKSSFVFQKERAQRVDEPVVEVGGE